MSKRKSPCRAEVKRDRGMWLVYCKSCGPLQWYHDKNEARNYQGKHNTAKAAT